jgi:hypothetical protein
METGIKSSFIPKDASVPMSSRAPRARTTFADLLVLISVVLLIASIALAAGVFLYLQYLQSASASKLEQLHRAKEAFDPVLIQSLTRLDDRIRAADSILSVHMAPSVIFHLLEEITLQTVSFKNFRFETADSQSLKIEMEGIAESVNSIALQADHLSKSGAIVSPIFSNIDRKADGVHFSLSASLNPQPLKYSQYVQGALPQPLPEALPAVEDTGPDGGFGFPGGSGAPEDVQ